MSYDNSKIAFVRRDSIKKETSLVVSNINGTDERVVAVRGFQDGFTSSGASWSPNGKHLAATIERVEGIERSFQIAIINSETGEQQILKSEGWNWAGQTAWLKDGKGIVVAAYRSVSPTLNDELWLIPFQTGILEY